MKSLAKTISESDAAAFINGIRAADKVLEVEFRLDVFHPERIALRDLIYKAKNDAQQLHL